MNLADLPTFEVPILRDEKAITTSKWAKALFIIWILMASTYGLYMIYPEYWWPMNPVDYHYIDFKTPVVDAGKPIYYELYMTKHTTKIPTITREFVSINGHANVNATEMTLGTGKFGKGIKKITIGTPEWMQHGKWYVQVKVIYPCWGGRLLESHYRTPVFEVR